MEYILRLLIANGYKPAVLSRGYKRKTRGFRLASQVATAQEIGDEPLQLYRKFPNIPVAVSEHRVRGLYQLQKLYPDLDAVVLDDAFQHRGLRCGLNILLTAYDNLYIDDHLLPWGMLRDLPSRALKADAIVVSKCPDTMRPIDMRVVDNRLHLPTFQLLHFAGLSYAPIRMQGRPLVVCGIAQPHYLLDHVRSLFPKADVLTYPDHHAYSDADIHTIMQRVAECDGVLTTEKDLCRMQLTTLPDQLAQAGKSLETIPIEMRFLTDGKAFDRQILTYVRENRRQANNP